jgi:hypothetical protein
VNRSSWLYPRGSNPLSFHVCSDQRASGPCEPCASQIVDRVFGVGTPSNCRPGVEEVQLPEPQVDRVRAESATAATNRRVHGASHRPPRAGAARPLFLGAHTRRRTPTPMAAAVKNKSRPAELPGGILVFGQFNQASIDAQV